MRRPLGALVPAVILALLLAACGGPALSPTVLPPTPVPSSPSVATPAAARMTLPLRLASTTWRVQSAATLRVSGGGTAAGPEQRVQSNALVSWSAERQPTGAVRATGQVDSFTVRTSFDSQRGTQIASTPSMILLEAVLDSTAMRVATRPPLANECDRPEAGAAVLARELLVRVPDGVSRGDRWQDSSVTLVCRNGVPMTAYTSVVSRLESLDADRLIVRRDLSSRFEGKGGTAFRGLELTGTGSGVHRVEISAQRGTVERLEGSGTLTLQATERLPGNPPRTHQIVQRSEYTAVRAR